MAHLGNSICKCLDRGVVMWLQSSQFPETRSLRLAVERITPHYLVDTLLRYTIVSRHLVAIPPMPLITWLFIYISKVFLLTCFWLQNKRPQSRTLLQYLLKEVEKSEACKSKYLKLEPKWHAVNTLSMQWWSLPNASYNAVMILTQC
jgi:hypothetical protein